MFDKILDSIWGLFQREPKPKVLPTGFPHMDWKNQPHGWDDRGEIGTHTPEGKTGKWYAVCGFCSKRLHIGIEDSERFKFCPVCLHKIT